MHDNLGVVHHLLLMIIGISVEEVIYLGAEGSEFDVVVLAHVFIERSLL